MKNKLTKIIASITLIATISLMCLPTSFAALQADGSAGSTKNIDGWMSSVRTMEQAGGALGKTETVNSNLTPSSNSNNMDVHMEKNTEYGALAILSASSYGKPTKINDGETTTGNKSGVYMYLNQELVAAGQVTSSLTYKNAEARYKNAYNGVNVITNADIRDGNFNGYIRSATSSGSNYVEKTGDAISETQGWHGSNASIWISDYTDNNNYRPVNANADATLLRAYGESIFSYYGFGYSRWSTHNWSFNVSVYYRDAQQAAYWSKGHASRAVIVVGERTLIGCSVPCISLIQYILFIRILGGYSGLKYTLL